MGPIKPEETELLRKLYEPKFEEGLNKFDHALSKTIHEFNVSVAQSEELDDLTRAIDKTNRALAMRYKREHKYKV